MSASSTNHDRSFSCRLYRLMLRCYPAQFRRMYAREMTRTFCDSYRDAIQQHGASFFMIWEFPFFLNTGARLKSC